MKLYLLAFGALLLAGAGTLHVDTVSIPPGTFEMGADATPLPDSITKAPRGAGSDRPSTGDYDEKPPHKVTISKPFQIGATEITIEQFQQFRPDYKGDSYYAPFASGISWDDAVAYCNWLSKREGKPYRLPTEAEWEYVARGIDANKWAVKNIHSSVAEWVYDWYGPYEPGAQTDPVGPASGIARVVRGGGLDDRTAKDSGRPGQRQPAEMAYFRRSANRASIAPTFGGTANSIGFRVVQAPLPATAPTPYHPPVFQSAIKQNKPDLKRGPDPGKPYYRKRPLFPDLGDRSMTDVGYRIGLARGLGVAYHNSAVQVLDNGDVVAAYYNTPKEEDDPDQSILVMRRRFGSEDWDMPEPWPDFADAADAAPVFWNDHGRLWLFWGCPRLLGALPFQFMQSTDNGATWGPVHFAKLTGPVGPYTPQPINSVVRSGKTIYLPVDAKGGTSVVYASDDDGATWRDTGGRTGGRHTTLEIAKDGALVGWGGKNTNLEGWMPKATSRDGGKTWELSKTPFRPLGSGQRPSIIRLASGRLFFVADWSLRKTKEPRREGAFAAISDDEGATWKQRDLPGIYTVGYTTATQAQNGVIHIVTSKNKPDYEIELNEQWVIDGGPETPAPVRPVSVSAAHETYPDGRRKASWSGGEMPDHQFVLDGLQTFYYDNGNKQWEATFRAGRRVGTETWWTRDGRQLWEKIYSTADEWTWRFGSAVSKWKGKQLLDAKL